MGLEFEWVGREKWVGSRIEVKRALTPAEIDEACILASRAPRSCRTGARWNRMLRTYTAKFTKIPSGYMGRLVEWLEVITEAKTLDDCRQQLQDALHEMILAYRQQHKEIPVSGGLIEQIPVEI